MKTIFKISIVFIAHLFLLSASSASGSRVITSQLNEHMQTVKEGELIRINITLSEQFNSQELIRKAQSLQGEARREYVVSVLKDYARLSQKGVLAKLNQMQRSGEVETVTTYWIANVINCYATPGAIKELEKRDDIASIDYDEYRILLDPNERKNAVAVAGNPKSREITWNVLKINADDVWALGYNGEGVVVSVIDTGVNYNHTDLEDHVWESAEYPNHGYDFANNDNDPIDDDGHGTHCAGTVAGDGTSGSQTGVAPEATIMCLKVLDANGSGYESGVWSAVEFSVDHGAHVMSLSLGWQHSWGPNRTVWRQTFDNALAAGVIASVAAGNEGDEQGTYPIPDNVRTPGDCPPPWLHPDQTLVGGVSSVICVGATTSTDAISYFSSRGPLDWSAVSQYNDYPYSPEMGLIRPDVCAPGSNIKSLAHYSNTGYESGWSGTSMATPANAGMLALLLQKDMNLSPAEISQITEETAYVLQAGKNNTSGSGRIDALAAIEAINALATPTNLTGNIAFATGQVDLAWEFTPVAGFEYFVVYRDDVQLGTTTDLTFTDFLPGFGIYKYEVTAMHLDGESASAGTTLQWGNPHVNVDPESLSENLQPGGTANRVVTITNTGQLPLEFSVSSTTEPLDNSRAYCTPTTNCSFGDGFETFIMAAIDNSGSGCSADGYGDFTNLSTELQAGMTYDVSFMTGYGNQNVCLWIDFNKNEVFDADELLLEDYNLASADQLYTTQVTIPEGIEAGTTRMRIKANWIGSANDPCESTSYGETEDYTVNVSGWLFVDNISGTLDPGSSQTVNVLLDAADLDEGTYYGNINVASDDPDAPSVDVPVTLNVANLIPLNIEVMANPEIIIEGTSSQLNATATGGSGNYTYSWYSDPAGFTSNIATPVVFPTETTTYFCEVSDGVETVSGQVTVTVESAQISQTIELVEGWNIFSSMVMPENPDMLDIVQPIIDNELLYKVIDENGGNIFFLPFPPPGQWNNSIGNIAATEGYYIKVNAATSLSLTGDPTELPLDIPLTEGWNMISFPAETAQDALAIVQPLIDADVLYKVIDQTGGTILHLPFPPPDGQWSNTIGNFEAGQGYYLKVTSDATLTIGDPADGYIPPVAKVHQIEPSYFSTNWQNNPYQPMTVAVKAAEWMEPGDEIAVTDQGVCVGTAVYGGPQDDAIIITVGLDDPETEMIDGAVPGNEIGFSLWNRNGQALYTNIDFEYLQGSLTFNGLETTVVELNPVLTQLAGISKLISLNLHPNPTNMDAVLNINIPGSALVTVNIIDRLGSFKTSLVTNEMINTSGSIIINKNRLNLTPGVYTIQVIITENSASDPVIKLMKFVVY